jgi:hypothetical protein
MSATEWADVLLPGGIVATVDLMGTTDAGYLEWDEPETTGEYIDRVLQAILSERLTLDSNGNLQRIYAKPLAIVHRRGEGR